MILFTSSQRIYKKLVNGVTDRFKISLIDGDGNEISSNFKPNTFVQEGLTYQLFCTSFDFLIMKSNDSMTPSREKKALHRDGDGKRK